MNIKYVWKKGVWIDGNGVSEMLTRPYDGSQDACIKGAWLHIDDQAVRM